MTPADDPITAGYRRLIARLLWRAVADLRAGNGHADDARRFLASEWGAFLAEAMGVDELLASWLAERPEAAGL
ncbi:MAG: hypothetical protein ACOYZ7_20450 [Chloroflexota bacterium]